MFMRIDQLLIAPPKSSGAFAPEFTPEGIFEIASKLYKKSR